YEMMCGVLPFLAPKDNYWSLVAMHLSQKPKPPRKINPQIPEKLEIIVMRTLEKDPKKRPSAKELMSLLSEFVSTKDSQSAAQTDLLASQNYQTQGDSFDQTIGAGINQITHIGTETQQAGNATEEMPVKTTVMPVTQTVTAQIDDHNEKTDGDRPRR